MSVEMGQNSKLRRMFDAISQLNCRRDSPPRSKFWLMAGRAGLTPWPTRNVCHLLPVRKRQHVIAFVAELL